MGKSPRAVLQLAMGPVLTLVLTLGSEDRMDWADWQRGEGDKWIRLVEGRGAEL